MIKYLLILFFVFVALIIIVPWAQNEIVMSQYPIVDNEISNEHNTFSPEFVNRPSTGGAYSFNTEKTKVYYLGLPGAFGYSPPKKHLESADAQTFRHVSYNTGVDKNNVYLESEIISDLSPKHFKRLSYGYIIGQSKLNGEDFAYYGRFKTIKEIDALSFEIKRFEVPYFYGDDGDTKTITYARDKSNVYNGVDIIPNLSPDGFEHLGRRYLFGKSKSGKGNIAFYVDRRGPVQVGQPINNIDAQTYRLESIWGNDKHLDYAVNLNIVYYKNKIVTERAKYFRRFNDAYHRSYESIKDERLKKRIRLVANEFYTDDHFIYSLNNSHDRHYRIDLDAKIAELLVDKNHEYSFFGMYLKDDNRVYFQAENSVPRELASVDAKSFEFICETYKDSNGRRTLVGMDENHVYRGDQILIDVTPDDFNYGLGCVNYVGE